ncbi:ABC.PE.P1 [Mytilus coruscus]|uniref:ABC.PE.P1 n=1 Tax=Mytilus coruscus TaxID=42192 RepID=A0A6J8ETJ2_MYTCO|nr:ABC.PE.P1 [Mytilus coruscus]
MENEPPSYDETNQNATNQASEDEKIKVWKCDLSLTFIKSIGGIFNVVLVVFSLLCLIVLGAAKRVDCFAAHTSSYGFYNFAFASCLLTYMVRYVIYIFNLNTRLLWVFPWLVWNPAVSLFFAVLFFISSIAVVANECGKKFGGYKAAAAFGFITFFIMAAELAYNIYLLRRDHAPTENRLLLFIGVEKKPPGNAPVYDQDNTTSDSPEESKY